MRTSPEQEPRVSEETDATESKLADLISGIVLAALGTFIIWNSGEGVDWAFPRGLAYILIVVGIVLAVLGVARRGRLRRARRHDGTEAFDAAVFCAITVAYVAMLSTLGVWLCTFLMVVGAGLFLTEGRPTRRRTAVMVVVATGVCLVGYVFFEVLFSINVPQGVILDY